ncbi:tyrosine-protein phosphatase [Actinomadura logoneensis]|uniref:Tyrosine-protein phosphatase n=1 Tax=Actinomadura logoneensis TaxID=2293572 RepID=A0A372JDV6_9ACTN|nr:tyrosine-protein phosphatase [Actinomadura logoneensis]RFU38195.1 tyrosine-protein phosphatase [Actinomadura logoneensis]
MSERTRWIRLEGAVNARDLGGLPTTDGRATRRGRVLRADNLQALTVTDVRVLLDDYDLKNVIDLRSDAEVRLEGPGPLTRVPSVTLHHLSLFAEGGHHTDASADQPPAPAVQPPAPAVHAPAAEAGTELDMDKILPWQTRTDPGGEDEARAVSFYLGYLRDRADSITAALRVMARTDGSALVHCAAGKDRTGVVCALALEVAGVTREAIVADYAQTGERIAAILDRLRASDTYAADIDSRPAESHHPHAAIMEKFLSRVDEKLGGTAAWLRGHGWTPEDTAALRARLLD